jgi:hypothetical protein
MRDRLTFAMLGLIFGVMLGAVSWWLYGLGLSTRAGQPALQPDFWVWVKYAGGGCALTGFLLKERIADLLGSAFKAAYDVEAGTSADGNHVPTWLAAVFLAGVAAAVWYFAAGLPT